MRIIITFLCVCLFTSMNAQELYKDEVDEFTGSVKKVSKTYILAKGVGKVNGSIGHIDDLYALYLWSTADLGCAGGVGSYIIFLFEDKTSYKVDKDHADIDCSDYATSIFVIEPKEFEGKTVSKIRFSQGDSYDDCTINSNTAEYTINQLIEVVQ